MELSNKDFELLRIIVKHEIDATKKLIKNTKDTLDKAHLTDYYNDLLALESKLYK